MFVILSFIFIDFADPIFPICNSLKGWIPLSTSPLSMSLKLFDVISSNSYVESYFSAFSLISTILASSCFVFSGNFLEITFLTLEIVLPLLSLK